MARNRVIYQSEELYISKNATATGSADHKDLERVQSANYNFSINRQDVTQYGMVGSIDRLMLEAPTVGFDFSYYLTDGFNERALGFYVQSPTFTSEAGFLSGHLSEGSGRNFYILTSSDGTDAIANSTAANYSVIGIGNAYLTNYGVEASVGSIPTVSISYEALNMSAKNGVSGGANGYSGFNNTAINQTDGSKVATAVALPAANSGVSAATALRPGDITLDITNFIPSGIANLSSGVDGIHIQSLSIDVPISRSSIQRLGSNFAFARSADFPVNATLNVSAIVNEMNATNLADIVATDSPKDVTITFRDRNGTNRTIYKLKSCSLDSQSFSSSIGSNKTIDLTFTASLGGASETGKGLFMSGANTSGAL
jgi:hypothetical protein